MKENQTSNTAILASMARSNHQLLDGTPKILEDPVSVILAKKLQQTEAWAVFETLPELILKQGRGMISLRSRYAEDVLKRVASRTKCQYVIFGAGYDTFSFRQPIWAKDVTIYEMDHPKTQKSKRDLIRELGLKSAENLHFCPIDFHKTSIHDALQDVAFDFSVPTVFNWLGVTQYISKEASRATLEFVSGFPKSSAIVFSFMIPDELIPDDILRPFKQLEGLAKANGEPFISRFKPGELMQLLTDIGYSKVEHLSPEMARERYYKNRTDGLIPICFEHSMAAFV